MDAGPGAKTPDPGYTMKNDDGRNEDYVLQVRDNTHKYIEKLIQENAHLRSLVSDLEEQQRQGEQQLGIAESERQKLAERIDQIETESQSLLDQFQEIEQQNSDLASLYVASYRLHETIEPPAREAERKSDRRGLGSTSGSRKNGPALRRQLHRRRSHRRGFGADRLCSSGARWKIDRSDRGVSVVGSEAEAARPARLRTLRSTRDPRGLRTLLLGAS